MYVYVYVLYTYMYSVYKVDYRGAAAPKKKRTFLLESRESSWANTSKWFHFIPNLKLIQENPETNARGGMGRK